MTDPAFHDAVALEAFVQEFLARTLPKPQWTHSAHLVVGLWHLVHHDSEAALNLLRQRIRAYNEAVGTANTANSGYHETLTRFFLIGLQRFLAAHGDLVDHPLRLFAALPTSALANKNLPLEFYRRETLFSARARQAWVEPDLGRVLQVFPLWANHGWDTR